jgi:hypothetical protein
MKIKHYLLILGIIFMVSCTCPVERGDNSTAELLSTSSLTAEMAGKELFLDITTIPYAAIRNRMSDNNVWRGISNDAAPSTVISDIELIVDGKEVVFPPESFTDLTEPASKYTLGVDKDTGKVLVVLEGGVSSQSYTVMYLIGDGRLAARQFVQNQGGGGYKVLEEEKY